MNMNLLEISRLLGIVHVGLRPEDALGRPTGAAIDSRKVKKGDLFFCLRGEHVDGHDFAEDAVRNGAFAVIASRDPFGGKTLPTPALVVPDVGAALAAIAAAHRTLSRAMVIGVTGTSGKTSVKETLAAVLGTAGKTAKNPVNLNNQIGLPLSMCNASEDADYWVMEAGISRPGDMDELGAILRPDIALVLNAGAGHVAELGDLGVAHCKMRLLAYLPPDGQAVVSADYPDLVREASAYDVDTVYFSAKHDDKKYYAVFRGPEGLSRGTFTLFLNGEAVTVNAPFVGAYGAENVAAVGAVAHIAGMTSPEIARGFADATIPAQRFTVREAGDFLVIDDSYNANPLSMSRMLEAAADMAAARGADLLLVLGEMGELGPGAAEYHRALGQEAAAYAPAMVFWKGGHGESFRQGLAEGDYGGAFTPVTDAAAFAAALASMGALSGVVLFKGSRGNKLEELVTAFSATIAGTKKQQG